MMNDRNNEITVSDRFDKAKIKSQIYEIRGYKVMLDSDIALYFGTTTGNLNKAMKRNIQRFPKSFCFWISRDEYREILRFQSGILELEQGQYSKYPPYVYTEQGVAMLTSCLHTPRAISASIQMMEARFSFFLLYVSEKNADSQSSALLIRNSSEELIF